MTDADSHAESSSSSVDQGESKVWGYGGTLGSCKGTSIGACGGERDRVAPRRAGGGNSCRSSGETGGSALGRGACRSSGDERTGSAEGEKRGCDGDCVGRLSWNVDADETDEGSDPEETWSAPRGGESSTHTLRSRGRPRASSPRPASTAARHCTRSLSTVSRRDNVRSFRLRKSWSRSLVLVTELVLSRVLTRSSPVVLLSLRIAAASRSGQSDRLTNSN